MPSSPSESDPAIHPAPLRFVRGLLLVAASFLTLFLVLSWAGRAPAQNRATDGSPDFPLLFRMIDMHLKQSYLDLDRIEPAFLVRRALASLELAADEIYVQNSDPDEPHVAIHVGDKVSVLPLETVKDRGDAVRMLEKVFDWLAIYYRGESSLNDLRYAAANGYLSGIDPHTLVFTPRSFEDFKEHIDGEIYGIGMLVGQNDEGRLQVRTVLKETPAFRAGFQRNDLITKIGDESTVNMSVPEAVQRIRGARFSKIVLTVKRKQASGEIATIPITVERDLVEIKSVGSKLLHWPLETEEAASEKAEEETAPRVGGIGYITVTNFDKHTFPSLERNLKLLQQQNGGKPLAGLILDFRGNSGGLLKQAILMVDAFIERGDIVGTAYKSGKPHYETAHAPGTQPRYPLILLADKGSASGAEIVIGALKQHRRGVVLGTNSFGKGSVQQLQRLDRGAQLKVTVSEYLLPGDVSIQESGVIPDIYAESAYITDTLQDLIPNDTFSTERDYERHLVSKYAKEFEPSYRLHYLEAVPDEELAEDEDRPTAQERFITGEIEPEKESLVQLALELISLAETPFDSVEFLTEKRAEIEAIGQGAYEEIVTRLGELDIDWSRPTPAAADTDASESDAEDPGAKLRTVLGYRIVEEPSEDEEDPVPVRKLVVEASVTNDGTSPVYRLKGLTRSDYYLFEEKEFLFGRVAPGKTVTRERKIRLPYFPQPQSVDLRLELSGQDDRVLATQSIVLDIEGKSRPQFAYALELFDAEGKRLEGLRVGAEARLRVTVCNTGAGPAHKGIAILRNETGPSIFLKKGRLEFDKLDASREPPRPGVGWGESADGAPTWETVADLPEASRAEVEFLFNVLAKPGEKGGKKGKRDSDAEVLSDRYAFQLSLVDSYSSESLTTDIHLPFIDGDQEPVEVHSDVSGQRLHEAPRIRLEAFDESTGTPILSTAAREVRLRFSVHAQENAVRGEGESRRGRSAGFNCWALALPLTPKHRNSDKFFFADSRGKSRKEYSTPVWLTPGVNLITIVAEDRNGFQARESVLVRRVESSSAPETPDREASR